MNPQLMGAGSGISLQGSSNTVQQTAPLQVLQPAATSQTLQPAVSPMPYTDFSAPVQQQQQPAGPTQAELAAQRAAAEAARKAAEEAAQRSQLQKNIQNLVGNAMGVYDSLYGNLRTAAASQKQALEQKFGRESGALGEQFTQEIPRIGQAYAGRGAYDSSWRINAENIAKQNFENQLKTMQEEQKAQMSKIGQEVATQEAQFQAGQKGLSDYLARIPGVTDIKELTNIQSEIQKRINELQASAAGLQTQEAYMQRFQQLAPATDRIAQLRQTLSTIIQGEAPNPLKQQVASQIVGSSGLTKNEQDMLINEFNTQLTSIG